ncbi:MAG: hypothetical protein JO230_22725 [Xanthobacteraceae bacterium]|nr:hypothetical protein [Xanthobacteraceae bacterium]
MSRHRRWRGPALGIPAMLLMTAFAGCAGHGRSHDDARANVYPENYKADLLGFLHSYINDANKIRDAAISEPALRPVPAAPAGGGGPMAISGGMGGRGRGGGGGGGPPEGDAGVGEGIGGLFGQSDKPPERYTVCVRYNARDFDGRYAGIKQGMAVYSRGRFDRFVPQPHGPCDEAEYKPFPELEALGR